MNMTKSLNSTKYLEPVDGAAVYKRGEHADPVPEGISDGTHGQNDMKLLSHSLHKQIEERQWCTICLL